MAEGPGDDQAVKNPTVERTRVAPRASTGVRAARTRGRLLEAAVRAFERDGYANATVDDIVALVPARRATFYLHFGSKRDVVYALLDELRDTSYMTVNPPVHRPMTPRSVREWFDDVVEYWRENRSVIAVVENASAHDREIGALFMGARRNSVDLLTSWIRDAGVDPDPRTRAMLLHSELRGFLALTIIQGWPWDEERALDLLAERWYAALSGEAATP